LPSVHAFAKMDRYVRTYDPQSMFCRNHKFACAAHFVGSGDCDDAKDCLALLAGVGKKFNVTVESHTTQTH